MTNDSSNIKSPLLSLAAIALFILPTFMVAKAAATLNWAVVGVVGLTAVCLFIFWQQLAISPRLRLGLVIHGMTLWGTGWIISLMVNAQIGWWLFTAGWLTLSFGLFMTGINQYKAQPASALSGLALFAGLWPVLFSTAMPTLFLESLTPATQLGIMFLFAIGWISIGSALAPSEPQPVREAGMAKLSSSA